MFLITAIKEVRKNPVSRSPPPCPPQLPSVSHNCCVLPAWEWQGGVGAAATSCPWSQGHAGNAPGTGTWDRERREAGEPLGPSWPSTRVKDSRSWRDGSPGAAGGT